MLGVAQRQQVLGGEVGRVGEQPLDVRRQVRGRRQEDRVVAGGRRAPGGALASSGAQRGDIVGGGDARRRRGSGRGSGRTSAPGRASISSRQTP